MNLRKIALVIAAENAFVWISQFEHFINMTQH